MMHYDLIVIGMGLSGLMAAKVAVEAKQKVLIIGKGMGSLCLFSNTIDVLGDIPISTKMREGLRHWINDHPDHPYSKVGPEGMEEALTSFLSLFPPPYSFQNVGDGNCLIPTGAGTYRPTYLIPVTMAAGIFLHEGEVLVVGFRGFKDFYADYVADHLKCRSLTLPVAENPYHGITATGLSRLMDRKSWREAIGWEIKKHLRAETRVGFPAILGMQYPLEAKKDLEERLGVPIFEIPILPPSIPGQRIFNRFKEWLIGRGVTLLLGHSVSKAILKGKICERIEVSHPPIMTSYSSDRYVLATGRYMSGGLYADMEKVSEPIFGVPVFQPEMREGWFKKSFFDETPHPIHQAGIRTDSSLRAVDGRGERVLENVWIAGTILAHHHCIEEKSREGIEIGTGYWATKWALGR